MKWVLQNDTVDAPPAEQEQWSSSVLAYMQSEYGNGFVPSGGFWLSFLYKHKSLATLMASSLPTKNKWSEHRIITNQNMVASPNLLPVLKLYLTSQRVVASSAAGAYYEATGRIEMITGDQPDDVQLSNVPQRIIYIFNHLYKQGLPQDAFLQNGLLPTTVRIFPSSQQSYQDVGVSLDFTANNLKGVLPDEDFSLL